MSIVVDLAVSGGVLSLFGGGAALIHLVRPRRAVADDGYSVSDYRPTPGGLPRPVDPAPAAPGSRLAWPTNATGRDVVWTVDRRPMPPRRGALRPAAAHTEPVTLAARQVPWTPPYADLIHAQVVRRHGDSPADIAARMLREIAAEQRATAGAR
ncbi:hypothetical protein FJK98_02255 [Micromonospora sp. HM134]|uniref:hypothetical protein n=1 Tax=Micromonospora sp. HM134 TaxID=2583243 RepID=UPI001198BB54|nr:hypothetical protein [Micromonospora sp. HM134]QDY06127.1 hypothetical protein FJK98_02255 [Micromonospora sp. HM134]